MRILVIAILFVALHGMASAVEPAEAARPAIDRAAAFLVKDALAWKAKYNCASCHHAALVAWALHETKTRGHAVDEPVLAELTTWLTTAGSGKTGVPRPEGIPKAFNARPIYYAFGLSADPQPDEAKQAALKLLLATVKEDQLDSGSWASWPDTRPPIFGHSDENATAIAVLALVPAANAGDADAAAARDRGLAWLADHAATCDHQATAIRLIALKKSGRAESEWQPLVEQLIQSQQPDGGWRQAAEMASDAHATGQALYALALAGRKTDDPAVVRGREFLIKTQREDGGWTMTSRPTKPGGEGAKNLVPITGAGSAWGLLGLVSSTEPVQAAKQVTP